jgi:hypothetical protein
MIKTKKRQVKTKKNKAETVVICVKNASHK